MKKVFFRIFLTPLLSLLALQAGLFVYLDHWTWSERMTHLMPYTVFSTVFILLVTGIYSLWIAHNITAPLQDLTNRIQRFPEGLTRNPVRASRLDEIHEFYESMESFFHLMKDQIKGLHLEKELLSSLLNSLREGVVCLNSEGIIIFQNNAIDTELVEPDGIGRPYFKAIRHPRMLECINENIQDEKRLLEEYRHSHQKDENHHEDFLKPVEFRQGKKHFKMMCYPILMDERLELYLIIVHDGTRDEQIKRLREDFLQNASHELKTPITSIRGYAETIQYKSADEKIRDFAGAVLRNVGRMERLIEDMTTISSLESGVFPFNPENLSLEQFMHSIEELVTGTLKQKSQNLSVHIELKNPVINADPLLMEHLLLNLIVNASRYSPENTEIRVFIRPHSGNQVLFSVEDEGPGVEEEYRDKIFERFFRVDRNRSRSQGGTGLGLSIVRQIARLHGGSVSVENRPGGGSAFRAIIPS